MRTFYVPRLLLGAIALCAIGNIAFAQSNEAEVGLTSNLSSLNVIISQHEGPKQGNCAGGYTWMAQYGGCTNQQTEWATDTIACPAGYTGTQSQQRSRPIYRVQFNGAVYYGGWTYYGWNTAGCRYVPESLYSMSQADRNASIARSTVLAVANGGSWNRRISRPKVNPLGGSMALAWLLFDPNYNRVYCFQEWWGTPNESGQSWEYGTLAVGEGSNHAKEMIHLHTSCSTNGSTGSVYGTCIRTSGGDADSCVAGTRHYP